MKMNNMLFKHSFQKRFYDFNKDISERSSKQLKIFITLS